MGHTSNAAKRRKKSEATHMVGFICEVTLRSFLLCDGMAWGVARDWCLPQMYAIQWGCVQNVLILVKLQKGTFAQHLCLHLLVCIDLIAAMPGCPGHGMCTITVIVCEYRTCLIEISIVLQIG